MYISNMHVLYLYFFTYLFCVCVSCVHAEEGSEEKITRIQYLQEMLSFHLVGHKC